MIAAVLWGLAGVCIKSITWGTMSIISIRNFFSLLVLLAARRNLKISLTKTNVLCGVIIFCIGIAYVQAVKLTTAGTAIVLQYVAPILVFLFEVVFRGRKPRIWQIILTAFVFFGIVLSFLDSIDMTHVLGNLLALLSGFLFAAQIIIMNGSESNSEDCVTIGNLLSFVLCLPFVFRDPSLSLDMKNIVWVLVLGIFQYGLANLCFAKGCKLVDSVECSLILTIEPIFNPIPVAIICGEMMGPLALVGAAIVIASVTLYAVMPELLRRRALKAK